MLTSIAKIFNPKKEILNNQSGFSLLEILIALVLVATVFTIMPFDGEGQQKKNLDESLLLLDRAVRFSVNEAVLRNVIVRLKFDLESSPMEYAIEYGNSAELVLPEAVDESRLSRREAEELEKRKSKFNNKFTPVTEFQDGKHTLPEYVSVYAVGTSYYPDLITEGEVSIYFYPSGERDSTLIILNTERNYSTYSIAPFEDKTFSEVKMFEQTDQDNLSYVLEEKAKEEFDRWLKN